MDDLIKHSFISSCIMAFGLMLIVGLFGEYLSVYALCFVAIALRFAGHLDFSRKHNSISRH